MFSSQVANDQQAVKSNSAQKRKNKEQEYDRSLSIRISTNPLPSYFFIFLGGWVVVVRGFLWFHMFIYFPVV